MATTRPTEAPAAVHVFRCPTCGDTPAVTAETRLLPCGHFTAFRTQAGVVMFWVDTVAMTLKLERACTSRMAERAEQHAAGVQRWRDQAQVESETASQQ